ncbi:MAG: nicotinamide-nucleotide amidohydrolase family protein, partial [Candidatus Latescibacteria bacterium]|nr:nicotinamide-nucleotide amidohydrolase family protein [Candidatus Latescibacterota bacterium]
GVPKEMRQMLEGGVLPVVKKLARGEEICRLTLRTTGISESALFEKLKHLKEMASVAFLPGYSGVDIRITIRDSRAGERVQTVAQQIRRLAGDFVYGTEKETLEEVVGRQLRESALKLAVAESCTGGLIAHRLTNIPGSSDYFERGVVTYSNESKVQLLGISAETIREYGAVSTQTAEAMALGVRKLSGTDIGLSITGIAGPTGATPTKSVGLIYIGFSTPEETISKRLQFGDDRLVNKERMSQAALEMLWRKLNATTKESQ